MIVDQALYRDGIRQPGRPSLSELAADAAQSGSLAWIDIRRPGESEFAEVASLFHLHPLAVEDAIHAHQRPKLERYGETDKIRTGLGEGVEQWSVPYWYVDSAFSAMVALLAAVDEGLGAVFFGQFEHEAAIKEALGIPTDRRPVGTIALGHAAAEQRMSRSARRPRRSFDEIVHRGGW